MKIKGKLPAGGYIPGEWKFRNAGHDLFGRIYVLNSVRPVTPWRAIRARLGWHERDSLRSGFRNKPVLKNGATHFDGTQEMRAYK